MSIFFDILLVLVFAAIIFKGWFKGFFKSILGFGRLVLTVILTILLGPTVSAWLDQTYINPPVFNSVHAKLADMAAQAGDNVSAFFDSMSDKFGSVVDPSTFENQSAGANAQLDALVEEYSLSISASVSIVISTIIGYIALFLICFLVLTLVIWLLGKLVKLPVINKIDKLLGFLLGIVSGYLVVSLLATLLYAILVATGDVSAYSASHVFKFFYDFNLFQSVLTRIL